MRVDTTLQKLVVIGHSLPLRPPWLAVVSTKAAAFSTFYSLLSILSPLLLALTAPLSVVRSLVGSRFALSLCALRSPLLVFIPIPSI